MSKKRDPPKTVPEWIIDLDERITIIEERLDKHSKSIQKIESKGALW